MTAGLAPFEGFGWIFVACLFSSFWWLIGTFWLVDPSPISAFMFTWILLVCICVQIPPFYKDTSYWIRSSPYSSMIDFFFFQYDWILTNFIHKDYFQIRSCSEVLGVRTSNVNEEGEGVAQFNLSQVCSVEIAGKILPHPCLRTSDSQLPTE